MASNGYFIGPVGLQKRHFSKLWSYVSGVHLHYMVGSWSMILLLLSWLSLVGSWNLYSCAPLNNYPIQQRIRITTMFLQSQLRSQNDVLMGFFHFVTIGSLLREPILRITTITTADCRVFKMAAGCSKWLPAVFRRHFSLNRHPKMAAVWNIFAGRLGISPTGTH